MSTNTAFGFDEGTSEVSGKFIQITPETAISEGRFIESMEFIEDGEKSRFKAGDISKNCIVRTLWKT